MMNADEKLRRYFENYGAVHEAFVSYDKRTGRPRGFGFVVFTDPAVAEKVIKQQHTIDRREVEAKRALPREESPVSKDQRAAASGHRTRKIFVGGLPQTIDEASFRSYFESFGVIEDAVVMYDQDNKRPRGFGFITYAEERDVEKVFAKGSLHMMHDKQIEIKRAVPKDDMMQSPSMASRNPPPYYGSPLARTPPGGTPSRMNIVGNVGHITPYSRRTFEDIVNSSPGNILYRAGGASFVTGMPSGIATPAPTSVNMGQIPSGGVDGMSSNGEFLLSASTENPPLGAQSPLPSIPIAIQQHRLRQESQGSLNSLGHQAALQSPHGSVIPGSVGPGEYSLQNGMQTSGTPLGSADHPFAIEQKEASFSELQHQAALHSMTDALEQLQLRRMQQSQNNQQQNEQQQQQYQSQKPQTTMWI